MGILKTIFNPEVTIAQDEPDLERPDGVNEIENITSVWSKRGLWIAWGSMLLLAVAIALDAQTVFVYSTFATSSFKQMSLLSSLGVVQSVMYIATRPVMAKIADVLGRFEGLLLSIVVLTVGFIMLAASPNIGTYFAAQIFYVFGQVGIQFMQQVFAADTSDLKNRTFFVILPNLCYLFVPWCAAPITNAVLKHTTWQWGYGMWCIIVPVVSIPVLTTMFVNKLKARRLGLQSGLAVRNFKQTVRHFDFVGLILLTAGLVTLFLAATLVKTSADWTKPHVLGMIIVGPICLTLFPIWEMFPKYPFLPFRVLKNRVLLTCCFYIALYFLAFYLYQPYYYAWLLVCKNLSVTAATNTSVTTTVSSTAGGLITALAIRYTKRIKPFIVAGSCLYLLGLGLTYNYRQPYHSLAQFIVSQAVEGVGAGMLGSPTQVMVQAVVSHNQVAAATAVYLSSTSIGNVIGDAISGAMYRQMYPKRLREYAPFLDEAGIDTIINDINDPLKYAWGSVERTQIVTAFNNVYRHMLYGPLIVAGAMIIISLTLPDINLDEIEQQVKGVVFGKSSGAKNTDENPVGDFGGNPVGGFGAEPVAAFPPSYDGHENKKQGAVLDHDLEKNQVRTDHLQAGSDDLKLDSDSEKKN